MKVADAHVHFWDPHRIRYPWLDSFPAMNRPMLLRDYDRACGGIEVDAMYFVQAECLPEEAAEEVRFVSELASLDSRLQGIVAFAPLENGDGARQQLDHLARNPLVRGIRRMIKSEADLDFCLRPRFVEGVRALADYGFSFALGINHRHLKNTASLVDYCPSVRFVIDHFAQPDMRNRTLDPWREQMRILSEFPNVWCKLSSPATEADHDHWTIADVRPYVEHVLECWGFARTMFGTDWPVSSQAATIPQCTDAIGHQDQQALYHDTCIHFYEDRPPAIGNRSTP